MKYVELLYRFALKNKCSFHLYINPEDNYISCFLYSKGDQVIDYWTRDGEDKVYFTVCGKQFENYEKAINYYERVLILDKENNNDWTR